MPLAIDLFCGLGGWTDGFLAEGWNVVGFDVTRHAYGADRYPAQLVLQDVLTIHGSQFRNADIIVASPPCQQYSWLAMPWSRSKDPNNSKAAKALRAKWEAEGPDNRLFDACFRIQCEASEAAGHHIPLIVENVRGAQEWVGRAPWNYGSFYLWGDVPALMPPTLSGRKQVAKGGNWFGIDGCNRPTDRSGNARQQAVDHIKTPGRSLSKGAAAKFGTHNMGSADRIMAELGGSDAVKVGGDWFRDPACHSAHASRSNARKAASAMIAKIPLPLSTHIARVYWPIGLRRPAARLEPAAGTSGPAFVPEPPVSA